jgi:hypothetical protein
MLCSDNINWARTLNHPQAGVWEIEDEFSGAAIHKIEWYFHFAPNLQLELDENACTLKVREEGRLFVTVTLPERGIRFQIRDSYYSHNYGQKQINCQLYGVWHGNLRTEGIAFGWLFRLNQGNDLQKVEKCYNHIITESRKS